MSMTKFLQISWPHTPGGQMAAPDPGSHPYSRQDRRKNKAAIVVPSKNPPLEDFCVCPIGQNYDTWPPQPQRRLEKMIHLFQPL